MSKNCIEEQEKAEDIAYIEALKDDPIVSFNLKDLVIRVAHRREVYQDR